MALPRGDIPAWVRTAKPISGTIGLTVADLSEAPSLFSASEVPLIELFELHKRTIGAQLAKPFGAAMRLGWRGQWLRSRQSVKGRESFAPRFVYPPKVQIKQMRGKTSFNIARLVPPVALSWEVLKRGAGAGLHQYGAAPDDLRGIKHWLTALGSLVEASQKRISLRTSNAIEDGKARGMPTCG
jgi:hypothetical protein